VVGTHATRIAFLLYLTNKAFNEIIIRCFANGIETILNIIAFYYFIRCKDKFNKNYVIITVLLSINFMIRNTSAISWVPLFLIKIFKKNSFKALLTSLILIAIPVVSLCVLLDSYFYGMDHITITPLNFLYYNVLLGYS
jgi:hypothetical protein